MKFIDVGTTSVNSGSEKITESDHPETLVVGNPEQIDKCRSVHVIQNCGLVPETEASLIFQESRYSSDTNNNCVSSEGEDIVHSVQPERFAVEGTSYMKNDEPVHVKNS